MKIIKAPETNWSIQFTCTNCTAQLEVETADIIITHFDGDYREPAYNRFSFKCPICNVVHFVSNDSIPKGVQVAILRRLETK